MTRRGLLCGMYVCFTKCMSARPDSNASYTDALHTCTCTSRPRFMLGVRATGPPPVDHPRRIAPVVHQHDGAANARTSREPLRVAPARTPPPPLPHAAGLVRTTLRVSYRASAGCCALAEKGECWDARRFRSVVVARPQQRQHRKGRHGTGFGHVERRATLLRTRETKASQPNKTSQASITERVRCWPNLVRGKGVGLLLQKQAQHAVVAGGSGGVQRTRTVLKRRWRSSALRENEDRET